MKIAMIAAMAKNRVIGKNNDMPWHLPADLKHFKQTTLGKPIVMGRKTYESIGKALPGRLNIVISSDASYHLSDAQVVNSCEKAIEAASQWFENNAAESENELMIVGGGTIYQHFLPLCHRLYLTYIELDVAGDTHFPDYQSDYTWQESASESHEPDPKNLHNYRFVTLEKID